MEMEWLSFDGTTRFSEDSVSWSVAILGLRVSGPLVSFPQHGFVLKSLIQDSREVYRHGDTDQERKLLGVDVEERLSVA